jgi:hypothetical protein
MHRAGSRLGSSVESNFHILIIAQDKEERQLIFGCNFIKNTLPHSSRK